MLLPAWLVRLASVAIVAALPLAAGGGGASASGPANKLGVVMASLSLADKVGQMVIAGLGELDAESAGPPIRELRVGGVVLGNRRNAEETRATIAQLQAMADESGALPLLIAVDQEGGRVQRIRSGVTTFGEDWLVGAIQPLEAAVAAACARGATQGRELGDLGITMNFAPVLDVWDNSRNTVIATRAFSDDPAIVARLGAGYVEALQATGVLAVGKHFPGHGSSADDSHLMLPVVQHDRAWLDNHELVPFRAAIQSGVSGIMTAHVSYPLVDPVPDRPGSLASPIVTDILRTDLGFDGLVVADDLAAMKAIADRYEPGEAAVQAVRAGTDLIISVGPFWRQQRMVEAIEAEVGVSISPQRIDASVRRIMRAKQQTGLVGQPQALANRSVGACPIT